MVLPEDFQAEELFAIVERNRGRLEKWLPWVHSTTSVQDIRDFIRTCHSAYERKDAADAIILLNYRIVGACGLRVAEKSSGVAELGYWLDQEHIGKGIITDCCRTFLRYGFETMRLNRIQILCAPENLRSRAIAKRLRMAYEGCMRKAHKVGNKMFDLEIWSMLKEEWEQLKRAETCRNARATGS